MSVYKRGEMWYVDFQFMKKRYRRKIGPSRKSAQKIIDKLKTQIVENRFLDPWQRPDPIRFKDFVERYYLKHAGRERRLLSRLKQVGREFDDKIMQEISAWQIQKYVAKRKEEVRPSSVNRETALLKTIFSRAIQWNVCKENPAKQIKLFKEENVRVRYLLDEEIWRLIDACDPAIRPIVTFAIFTGIRRGNLLSLTWDHVDLDRGIVTLEKTKSKKRLDIPLNEPARSVLRDIPWREGRVFRGRDGGPLKESGIRKRFARALKKSGIVDMTFHSLRHVFASALVMKGVDLNVVRELLGHSDMKMTLRYAFLAPSVKTAAVSVLDSVMAQKPPQNKDERKVIALRP